jgi:predicted metalloprotease with PDZ domain
MRVMCGRPWAITLFLLGLIGLWQTEARGQPRPSRDPEKTLIEEGRKGKLGVVAHTVANGARIMYVTKGSPAWEAGLEPGDVIVSVDGFTVGFIDGVEFPLQSEVRRIKGSGAFRIRSWRTGEIVTKTIRIGPAGKGGDRDGPPKDREDPGPRPAKGKYGKS